MVERDGARLPSLTHISLQIRIIGPVSICLAAEWCRSVSRAASSLDWEGGEMYRTWAWVTLPHGGVWLTDSTSGLCSKSRCTCVLIVSVYRFV